MACEPTTRLAVALLLLSSIIVFTGNPFLGFVGVITGSLSLSASNFQRSPDLIAMLAFVTSISALMQLFTILPFGFYLLFSDPAYICGYSKAAVERFRDYDSATVASQPAVVGYPYNMTETAQGHGMPGPSNYPQTIKYATTVSGIVCGDHAKSALFGLGMAVLAFALLVVLPLSVVALRLMRHARHNGGCAGCEGMPMQTVVVQVPRYQMAPGGRVSPPPPRTVAASAKPAGSSCSAPIAQAVPVSMPTAVRGAPSMH